MTTNPTPTISHRPRVLGPIQGVLYEPAARATCNCRSDWLPFRSREAAEQWVAAHQALYPIVVTDETFAQRSAALSLLLNDLSTDQLAEMMDIVFDRLRQNVKKEVN